MKVISELQIEENPKDITESITNKTESLPHINKLEVNRSAHLQPTPHMTTLWKFQSTE